MRNNYLPKRCLHCGTMTVFYLHDEFCWRCWKCGELQTQIKEIPPLAIAESDTRSRGK